jgi:glycosidase
MYYGTEILMAATDGHGEIREDFWGGWPEDSLNKFNKEGRSDLENEAFDFIQSLANFRKNSSALTEGKLVQFVPKEGVYCYFRYSADEEIMVIVNASEKVLEEKLDRYEERLRSKSTFTDALTQEALPIEENLELGPFETRIFVVK